VVWHLFCVCELAVAFGSLRIDAVIFQWWRW